MATRYLFNTAGNYVAFQQGTNVFAPSADWLGFLLGGNQLYSTDGHFLGYVLNDDRVAKDTSERPRPPLSALQRPMRPLRPLKPLKPLKRLRKPRLPPPYVDVFEEGIIGAEPGSLGPDVSLDALLDSTLIAADGKLLGNVNKNPFDTDSITNQFGPYGNPYNAGSLFNEYGPYGSPYSALSPYNEFSRTPPHFMKGGNLLAYLTVNQFISPRVDPKQFRAWLGR